MRGWPRRFVDALSPAIGGGGAHMWDYGAWPRASTIGAIGSHAIALGTFPSTSPSVPFAPMVLPLVLPTALPMAMVEGQSFRLGRGVPSHTEEASCDSGRVDAPAHLPSATDAPPDAADSASADRAHFLRVAQYGAPDELHESVFPDAEAPALIAGALERLWAAALTGGVCPQRNVGGRAPADVVREHRGIARRHLGYEDGGVFPCGAVHGGYSLMGGAHGFEQQWRFNFNGQQLMAPYGWKIHRAIREHDPQLDVVLSRLAYAMEHLLLRAAPHLWLQCQDLWGDLDSTKPTFGRLYDSFNNQFVVNKNLLLGWHNDDANHPDASTRTPLPARPTPTLQTHPRSHCHTRPHACPPASAAEFGDPPHD